MFYQVRVVTYGHTHIFTKSLIQNQKTKTNRPSFRFLQVLIFQNLQEPVDRPGRPTCTNCVCARRPTARVDRTPCSLLCLFGSTGAVDRSPPTVKNMTVGDRRARSTGSCQKFWQTPTALFSDRICWDLTPTNLFCCFAQFFNPYK